MVVNLSSYQPPVYASQSPNMHPREASALTTEEGSSQSYVWDPFGPTIVFDGMHDEEVIALIDNPKARTDCTLVPQDVMKSNIAKVAYSEHARSTITKEEIEAVGIPVLPLTMQEQFEKPPYHTLALDNMKLKQKRSTTSVERFFYTLSQHSNISLGYSSSQLESYHTCQIELNKGSDFFAALADYQHLYLEIAKYCHPKSLVKLYSLSKPFHDALDDNLEHTVRLAAAYQAPDSSRIYLHILFDTLCIPDPAGRSPLDNPDEVLWVPSLRWLAMVVHREECIKHITISMEKAGHRLPGDIELTLKKMWLLMDVSTNEGRRVR
jgi:hypothetical protein